MPRLPFHHHRLPAAHATPAAAARFPVAIRILPKCLGVAAKRSFLAFATALRSSSWRALGRGVLEADGENVERYQVGGGHVELRHDDAQHLGWRYHEFRTACGCSVGHLWKERRVR